MKDFIEKAWKEVQMLETDEKLTKKLLSTDGFRGSTYLNCKNEHAQASKIRDKSETQTNFYKEEEIKKPVCYEYIHKQVQQRIQDYILNNAKIEENWERQRKRKEREDKEWRDTQTKISNFEKKLKVAEENARKEGNRKLIFDIESNRIGTRT